MKSFIHVSPASKLTRKETVNTLRLLLENHTPRKLAFLSVSKMLKAKHLPHSKKTIYNWCKEFGVKNI